MRFEEQSLAGFLSARSLASEMLHSNGTLWKSRSTELNLGEALVMQTAAQILTEQYSFYGSQVFRGLNAHAPNTSQSSVGPILHRFEYPGDMTVGELEDPELAAAARRPRRYIYTPTDFGRTVFSLFTDTEGEALK